MGFRKSVVEIVDAVIDELRMRMERPVFVFEKPIRDFLVKGILHGTDGLAGQDQDVVVAHVVGRYAELYPLVVIDILVFSIASEQHDHAHVFDMLADQPHQLPQVLSFVFG